MHREPDVGLDPRSPGSRPGPKAGAKPLCHPGIPGLFILKYSNKRQEVVAKANAQSTRKKVYSVERK